MNNDCNFNYESSISAAKKYRDVMSLSEVAEYLNVKPKCSLMPVCNLVPLE